MGKKIKRIKYFAAAILCCGALIFSGPAHIYADTVDSGVTREQINNVLQNLTSNVKALHLMGLVWNCTHSTSNGGNWQGGDFQGDESGQGDKRNNLYNERPVKYVGSWLEGLVSESGYSPDGGVYCDENGAEMLVKLGETLYDNGNAANIICLNGNKPGLLWEEDHHGSCTTSSHVDLEKNDDWTYAFQEMFNQKADAEGWVFKYEDLWDYGMTEYRVQYDDELLYYMLGGWEFAYGCSGATNMVDSFATDANSPEVETQPSNTIDTKYKYVNEYAEVEERWISGDSDAWVVKHTTGGDHRGFKAAVDNKKCGEMITWVNQYSEPFRERVKDLIRDGCEKAFTEQVEKARTNLAESGINDETKEKLNNAISEYNDMKSAGEFTEPTERDGLKCKEVTYLTNVDQMEWDGRDDGLDGDDNTAEPDCYTNAASLGWILCPIINQGGDFVTMIYEKMIEPFLVLDSGLFDTKQVGGKATYEAWAQFQTYANIVFIAIFLVVIFSQLTGYGIDNYGIKKILPKLIVAALMINLSYIICQLAVDIANIAGYGMKSVLEGIGKVNLNNMSTIEAPGAKPAIATGILVGLVALLVVPALLSQGTAILVPVFIAIIGIVIAVFTLFCILAIRKAFAVVLVVISPMAFVCYMLPNTKKLFDKWFTAFKATLIAFPICSGMVYGGQAVARILVQASGGTDMPFLVVLSAAVMSIAPVFLIPSTLKKSMGAISGLVDRASGRVGHFAKGRAMNSRGARYLQRQGEQRMMARQGEYNRKKASKALYKGSLAGRALQGVTGGKYQAGLANKAKLSTTQRRAYNAALGALSMEDQSQIDTNTARFKALGSDDAIISQVETAAAKGRLDSNMMAAAVNAIHDENKIADVMKAADEEGAMSKLIAGSDPNSVSNRQKISSALAGRSGNIIAQSMGKLVNEGKSYGQMTSNGANSDLAKKVQSAGTSVMASQDKDVFDMAGAADYFSAEQKAAGVSAGYSGSTADKFNNMLSGMSQDQKDAVLNEMKSGDQWSRSSSESLEALGGTAAIQSVAGSNADVQKAINTLATSEDLHAQTDAGVLNAIGVKSGQKVVDTGQYVDARSGKNGSGKNAKEVTIVQRNDGKFYKVDRSGGAITETEVDIRNFKRKT